MQEQHQPIKRSRQLAALSREHHDGLLFVWKIREGISLEVPACRVGNYCGWFWQNNLRDHFKKEEHALSSLLPLSDVLLNTMIEDHQAISEKIEQVIDEPSYYSLQRLAQIIYYHIRFEERSLFNHIERVVSAEELEHAVKYLSAEPGHDASWNDEFWIRRPKAAA